MYILCCISCGLGVFALSFGGKRGGVVLGCVVLRCSIFFSWEVFCTDVVFGDSYWLVDWLG